MKRWTPQLGMLRVRQWVWCSMTLWRMAWQGVARETEPPRAWMKEMHCVCYYLLVCRWACLCCCEGALLAARLAG